MLSVVSSNAARYAKGADVKRLCQSAFLQDTRRGRRTSQAGSAVLQLPLAGETRQGVSGILHKEAQLGIRAVLPLILLEQVKAMFEVDAGSVPLTESGLRQTQAKVDVGDL